MLTSHSDFDLADHLPIHLGEPVSHKKGTILTSAIYHIREGMVFHTLGNTLLTVYGAQQTFGTEIYTGTRIGEYVVGSKLCHMARWLPTRLDAQVQMFKHAGLQWQALAERCAAMSNTRIRDRLKWALKLWAKTLALDQQEGFIQIPYITHERIARYIGTTRPATTSHMNKLRDAKYIRYDYKTIQVREDLQW